MEKLNSFSGWFYGFLVGTIFATPVFASPITWVATNPNNDMNTPGNWNPNTIPGSGDVAVFDSTLLNVSTNPVEQSAAFTVSEIQFLNSASVFNFNFNNYSLILTGGGITGSQTNATINVTNINNSTPLTDQVLFVNTSNSSGSAIFNVTNAASQSGGASSSNVGVLNSDQISSVNSFSMQSGGNLTISNQGTDSSTGTGLNQTGYISDTQVLFSGTLTMQDSTTIAVSNSGTNNGSAANGNSVGFVGNSQFHTISTFNALDSLTLSVTNTGNNSGSSQGGNFVGMVDFGSQMLFDSSLGVGNHATIAVSNNGISSGSTTNGGNLVGFVQNFQLHVSGGFSAGDFLSLSATNTGNDSCTNSSTDLVGHVNSVSQMQFESSFEVGSHATIIATNSGTNSGSGSSRNSVGFVQNQQFYVSGASSSFSAGDYLNLNVTNTGLDNSIGEGGNAVGIVNSDSQVTCESSFEVGNNATIMLSNSGTNSGTVASSSNSVGLVQDSQFYVSGASSPFIAGDYLNLSATNTGNNSSIGVGNNEVGVIVGVSQLQFDNTFHVGDNATITAENQGTNSGNAMGGNNVGSVQNQQFHVVNAFTAGNFLNFSATNEGLDSGTGAGGDLAGVILSSSQIQCDNTFTVGDNATIAVANKGTNNSNATSGSNIGFVQNQQLSVADAFIAGNAFSLSATNNGVDSSTGAGGCFVGMVNSSSQLQFGSTFHVNDNATITVSNNGTNSGSTAAGNSVGFAQNQQFYVLDAFTAGNAFSLNATNSGSDSSTGAGGCFVGMVNSSSQLQFGSTFQVSDNATITVSNNGTNSGSAAAGNSVGFAQNQQFYVIDAFSAGDSLNLSAANSGSNSGTGAGSNLVGVINSSSQLEFDDTFTVGNNAVITVTNSGTNSGATTGNTIGSVTGSQFTVAGAFTAGTGLTLSATNTALNNGDPNNIVGFIGDSQLSFNDTFTIDDGALLTASNSGTVTGSQISFAQGFNITGKATIQAINQGTVGGYGILVQGNNSGGDANIILGNTSLNINTTTSTFTIGELNGDSTSTVQSNPQLIINTDPSVNANFAGAIQDYPSTVSTLLKTGVGTQKLSGVNTFTGLTTIQEGTLILTGSLAGNATVNPEGVLAGTGTVGGNVINTGLISPGESIGTLNILGNLNNNSGNYYVEVNGLGQSDLINVSGAAVIDGGTVYAISIDGLYNFQSPYTIVSAASVTGTYSGVTLFSPLLDSMLSYDANHVYLTFETAIERAARTHNQRAVAKRLDGIVDPNANQTLLLNEMIDLSPHAAREALDTLSGYQHTDDLWTTQVINRQFIRRLYDPLRCIVTKEPNSCCDPCDSCECDEWTAWSEGGGDYSHLKGNRNAHSFNMHSYEFTAGLQKNFCSSWTCGMAGSYEYDHLHYDHGGSGKNNTYLLGLYGLYRPNDYYGLFDITYGYSMNAIDRAIAVGPLHYTARSKPRISQGTFYGEVGVDFNVGCLLMQPFAGIETGKYWRSHVKEHESHGWGLSIRKKNWATTNSRLGVHLTMNEFCRNADISLDVALNRLLSSRKNTIDGRFIQFGDSYHIKGVDLDRNSIDYALTISTDLLSDLRGYLEFAGESWQHLTMLNLLCGVELSW